MYMIYHYLSSTAMLLVIDLVINLAILCNPANFCSAK